MTSYDHLFFVRVFVHFRVGLFCKFTNYSSGQFEGAFDDIIKASFLFLLNHCVHVASAFTRFHLSAQKRLAILDLLLCSGLVSVQVVPCLTYGRQTMNQARYWQRASAARSLRQGLCAAGLVGYVYPRGWGTHIQTLEALDLMDFCLDSTCKMQCIGIRDPLCMMASPLCFIRAWRN